MDLKSIKIDFTDIKIVKWFTLGFLSAVLILDLIIFSSLMHSIGQAKVQSQRDISNLNYFKGLISNKDKLAAARIIPQEDIDGLLDEIQGGAGKDRLKIKIGATLENDAKDKGDNFYARKVFSVDVSGSLRNLGNFMITLRNIPDAVLDIESATVAEDEKAPFNVQAKMNFVVLTTKDEKTN